MKKKNIRILLLIVIAAILCVYFINKHFFLGNVTYQELIKNYDIELDKIESVTIKAIDENGLKVATNSDKKFISNLLNGSRDVNLKETGTCYPHDYNLIFNKIEYTEADIFMDLCENVISVYDQSNVVKVKKYKIIGESNPFIDIIQSKDLDWELVGKGN